MAVVSDCSGKGYFFARTESPALAKVSAETHRFFAFAEKKGGGSSLWKLKIAYAFDIRFTNRLGVSSSC